MSKFTSGDPVMVTSVNRGRSYKGTVTKAGRKLVTVAGPYGQSDTFRIDTGAKNDNYQHEHVWTLSEYADREQRAEQCQRLARHGASFNGGLMQRISTDGLRRVADLLDDIATAEGI